jgi:hypothetical protein
MVTVVDSTKQPLQAPEIIMTAASELNNTGRPVGNVIAALAQELAMPNTDQVQIGNTVFIGHRGKGKNKNVMAGRALNLDTARNFMRNGLKYIAYLQRKGVEYYRTDFDEKQYLTAFQFWFNKSEGTDTEIDVVQLDTGGYRAFIKIGEDSLAEFWRL